MRSDDDDRQTRRAALTDQLTPKQNFVNETRLTPALIEAVICAVWNFASQLSRAAGTTKMRKVCSGPTTGAVTNEAINAKICEIQFINISI